MRCFEMIGDCIGDLTFAFATAGREVVIGVNFVPASRPAAGSRLYLTFRYTIAITYQHLRLLSNTV